MHWIEFKLRLGLLFWQQSVQNFGAKIISPFNILEMINNILVIQVDGEIMNVNLDEVILYRIKEDGSDIS